jgi:hypothetical protein
MRKIDYKIFVPRGFDNYIRFDTDVEFYVEDIATINIHLLDDKVVYWLYFNIPFEDKHHILLTGRGKKPEMILLIGNNPYEIIGESEIVDVYSNKRTRNYEIKASFTVINASDVENNDRKKVDLDRSDLLDIRND